MLEDVLERKKCSLSVKITVKTLVSALIIALAVALPQLVHLAAGSEGGMRYLPMYLPVLMGGCLLGVWWGIGVGVFSPVVSFLLTSAFSSPMPALERLPFMMAELAVFAAVSGLFSKQIIKNAWAAFAAVIIASVAGRVFFLLSVTVFDAFTALSPAIVWSQIQTGLTGIVIQAVVVPVVIIALRAALLADKKD